MGLIEDEEGVVAPAEGNEVVEGDDVPIHGEDGVGDDDRVAGVGVGVGRTGAGAGAGAASGSASSSAR